MSIGNGTFVLFFSNLISKIFGAIYRLPLSNLLGAEGMGLYQMAFPVYSFLLTFITGGISIHLSKSIAKCRAKGDVISIYKEYKLAKNISIIFGIIFLVFLIVFAYPISFLQGNVNATYGYFAIAFGFIFAVMLGAFRGYYQGYENMKPTAISQMLEQVAKLVFGLVFAWIFSRINGYGAFGALLGISLSELLSFVYFVLINKKRIQVQNITITKTDYKNFIKQVTPISVSYMLLPLSALIDSFLIINLLTFSGFELPFATSMYGIQTGMILPLINVPNVLTSALALACIPQISYKIGSGVNVKQEVTSVFKLVYIFILPCVVGMYFLAEPIISNIFVALDIVQTQIAVNLLKFSALQMFFLCFITISNSILQALGQVKLPMITMAIGVAIKTLLTIIFVSNATLNIYGFVIAGILGYFVISVLNLTYIKRFTGFRLTSKQILSPVIASALMITMVLLLSSLFGNILNFVQMASTIIIGAVVYFSCLILLKEASLKDFKKALQIKRN